MKTIAYQPLFHTPKSMEELEAYLKNFNGSEAIAAMTASGMTWNYLASVVNTDIQRAYNTEVTELKAQLAELQEKPMYFDEWFKQRQSLDPAVALERGIIPDADPLNEWIWVFPGECYLSEYKDQKRTKAYDLTMGNATYAFENLEDAAQRLYMDWYIMECV